MNNSAVNEASLLYAIRSSISLSLLTAVNNTAGSCSIIGSDVTLGIYNSTFQGNTADVKSKNIYVT